MKTKYANAAHKVANHETAYGVPFINILKLIKMKRKIAIVAVSLMVLCSVLFTNTYKSGGNSGESDLQLNCKLLSAYAEEIGRIEVNSCRGGMMPGSLGDYVILCDDCLLRLGQKGLGYYGTCD